MKKNNNINFIKRDTFLDTIDYHINRNQFCERTLLINEAAVETFFLNRLLIDIGYKDKNIRTKESIETFKISKGSKKINYRPDYIIAEKGKPLLIIDAKHPKEDINDYVEQCAHYCLLLNRDTKTIKYFLLTNGIKTAL